LIAAKVQVAVVAVAVVYERQEVRLVMELAENGK